jgi:hypothetical protein
MRRWRFLLGLMAVLAGSPQASVAQTRRAEPPPPACVATCSDTCQKELTEGGCNPAVGLTSCRIKQDQCVAVCARKCPRA